MIVGAQQLAYHARALAQAHSLTPLARKYLDWAVAKARTEQPVQEIGIWAGSALLKGYCVRQVEEEDAGVRLQPQAGAADRPDLAALDEATTGIAAALRTGDGDEAFLLGDEDRLLEALDRIVASEVQGRLDHWRETVTDDNWAELEEWITWWVVKGYALRVAEAQSGALATA
jgi:hypothetical protein